MKNKEEEEEKEINKKKKILELKLDKGGK